MNFYHDIYLRLGGSFRFFSLFCRVLFLHLLFQKDALGNALLSHCPQGLLSAGLPTPVPVLQISHALYSGQRLTGTLLVPPALLLNLGKALLTQVEDEAGGKIKTLQVQISECLPSSPLSQLDNHSWQTLSASSDISTVLLLTGTLLFLPRHHDTRGVTGFGLLIFLISCCSLLKSALARNVYPVSSNLESWLLLTNLSSTQSLQRVDFLKHTSAECPTCFPSRCQRPAAQLALSSLELHPDTHPHSRPDRSQTLVCPSPQVWLPLLTLHLSSVCSGTPDGAGVRGQRESFQQHPQSQQVDAQTTRENCFFMQSVPQEFSSLIR